ncbi:SSD domain-containing protein [Citrus sinensis]|uniref:SSD domain-containing protein n=1 Tax=Citrus sinensis TaxID=2711 RepID=A0ACB8L5H3_CITSI|nr:SSD domain-containing protein [Citrus sinensis]
MLSIVFGYKASYCYMTATEHYASSDTCLSAFKDSVSIITYPVNIVIDETSEEKGKALSWEKAFIYNLTLSFSSQTSIEEELKRESTADVVTIEASCLVMFAYISVALGDTPRLSSFYIASKLYLSCFLYSGSVGFFSVIGVKSTLIIMGVIPFLVLAVRTQISNALIEVGPSITLASLSEFLAFAVGSFIPTPACHVFSMFAGPKILLLITFDCLRAEDNRIGCFLCIKVPSSGGESDEGIGQISSGLLARNMKLLRLRMVVVAVFLAFTVLSIMIKTGLKQQIVLPRDISIKPDYLRVGPPLYVVVNNYNYILESRHTNKLCFIRWCDSSSCLNEISRASMIPELSYIAEPAASWLDDFVVWNLCGVGAVSKDCTTLTISHLWSNLLGEAFMVNALPSADCAKDGHEVCFSSVDLNGYYNYLFLTCWQASEICTFYLPLNKQPRGSSRLSETLKIKIFPHLVFYIFFEQYLDICRTNLINIAVALGAIFIVFLIITSSSSFILAVLVMMVNNLLLKAVSVANLIMSIVIAVFLCAYGACFFCYHGNRDQRYKRLRVPFGDSILWLTLHYYFKSVHFTCLNLFNLISCFIKIYRNKIGYLKELIFHQSNTSKLSFFGIYSIHYFHIITIKQFVFLI